MDADFVAFFSCDFYFGFWYS